MGVAIDHVTVCGRDLERMRRAFQEIGLATEYGGAHANGVTHMALVGFEDGSYLELIAPIESEDRRVVERATGMMAGWMPLMLGEAGVGAWAIGVQGIQEIADGLRGRGVEVRGPEAGGRTKPDGTRLAWETAIVGREAAGAVLPFMIEDRTERGLRVQASAGARHAGFRGIAGVVIGVRDLSGASAQFERAFDWRVGAAEEHPEFGARLAQLSGTPAILAEALESDSWVASRVGRFGEGALSVLLAADAPGEKHGAESEWFGQRVRWFDPERVGARVGVVIA